MTDGIIQEVITKMYIERYIMGLPTSHLYQLQQELIEKIKQYELLCYKDNGQPTTYITKVRLIGDNE